MHWNGQVKGQTQIQMNLWQKLKTGIDRDTPPNLIELWVFCKRTGNNFSLQRWKDGREKTVAAEKAASTKS